MNYELFISLRYLIAKRKHIFVSLITIISVGGVALGVAALIVTLSVMNGFQDDLRNKILGMSAHITVLDQKGEGLSLSNLQQVKEKIKQEEEVIAIAPFVYGQIILRAGKEVSGSVIKGINPAEEKKVSDIAQKIRKGSLDFSSNDESMPKIVLGEELARNLGLFVGEEVVLISPYSMITPMGMMPRMMKFEVGGIFSVGMYEYDANMAFVSLSVARNLFNLKDKITGLEIKIKDIFKADQVAANLQEELDYPCWVRSWMSSNKNLFTALKLEKIGMFIILTLIVLVASFNIISTLILMTMEKVKDIGILKAMGAKDKAIMKIFVWEGSIIGFSGTVLGCVLGLVISKILEKYEFIKLPADVYYISTFPVKIQVMDFIWVGLAAVLISFLSTLYPAYKAARLDPCEAIRYE
ncbi:lipoprotein-releasing ABC transporter permease subunit [bacterium]|nr:lipoprotein-releasing ABC transporter permease subunit [bacterium]